MNLIKLCAEASTKEELADLLERMGKENLRFRMAILWALGEHEEFPGPPDHIQGKPRRKYYWRAELRKRARL